MRNIVGLAEKNPDLAKRGIRLRKFVQEISERITSKKIHAVGIVAGGMSRPLAEDHRQALLAWIPEVQETTRIGLDLIMKYLSDHAAEVKDLDRFETLYLGTVTSDGAHELYDGKLPFVDAEGRVLADQLDPGRLSDSGPSCRRGPRLPRTTSLPPPFWRWP